MEILTPFQKRFLSHFANSTLRDIFFLTGGTALSAFYLQHRYSEDLDFFTEQPNQVAIVLPELEKIRQKIKCKIDIRRQFASFLEVILYSEDGETIKCDFAQDSPYRLKPIILQETYHVFIDNELDIACNKLSALFDRAESKDFVDIFFVHHHLMPFEELLLQAKRKHVGLDEYWLAISLLQVEDLGPLPRMVKPIDVKELKDFFLDKAKFLMQ